MNTDAFINEFPDNARWWVGNAFFAAARSGATSAGDVVERVRASVARHDSGTPELNDALARALTKFPEQAEQYAAAVLRRDALSPAEKKRAKAEPHKHYRREWMANQPATQKQIRYSRSLGYAGLDPANRAEASELIEALKKSSGTAKAVEVRCPVPSTAAQEASDAAC